MKTDFLDPQTTTLEAAPDGILRALLPDRCGLRVEAICAFPMSHPREHIVLRDGGGTELGVIESLDALEQPSRELIETHLRRRYFLPQIEAILSATERFGSSQWDVETDRGRRRITTKVINEAISEVKPGRYIITDVEDNRYEIRDLSKLDDDSRARFLGKI